MAFQAHTSEYYCSIWWSKVLVRLHNLKQSTNTDLFHFSILLSLKYFRQHFKFWKCVSRDCCVTGVWVQSVLTLSWERQSSDRGETAQICCRSLNNTFNHINDCEQVWEHTIFKGKVAQKKVLWSALRYKQHWLTLYGQKNGHLSKYRVPQKK